jgi:hypothetical protein
MEKSETNVIDQLSPLCVRDDATPVSFADVLDALGPTALPALMFVCAAVNVIPAPPGTSGVLGIPLLIITLQRALGFDLKLPAVVLGWKITRTRFRDLVTRLEPWVLRAERRLKRRWQKVLAPEPRAILDWYLVILSATILVPLPFTAMMPAFSTSMIALGLIGRDGAFVVVGAVLGAFSIAVMLFVLYGVGAFFAFLIGS